MRTVQGYEDRVEASFFDELSREVWMFCLWPYDLVSCESNINKVKALSFFQNLKTETLKKKQRKKTKFWYASKFGAT